MRVAVYIGGYSNRIVDCRKIMQSGNPGIGGTDYEFILLSNFLQSVSQEENIDLLVFHYGKYIMDAAINQIVDVKPNQFANKCTELGIDIAIVDSRWPFAYIKAFKETKTKMILWSHCVGSYYRYILFSKWDWVSKVVFVSRGHLCNFIDSPISKKMSFAFNAVTWDERIDSLRKQRKFVSRPKDVVFLGALDKSKGFHVLAKAWPRIVEAIPDAKLHVIGSANLYGGNFKIGRLGIAEQTYEDTFARYLSGEDGNLLDSVVLHGQLAEEKYEVMSKCRVGVPNPDGYTETFCISAVEMQLCGCRVVTKWSSGYIDTVPPPNILINNEKSLSSAIIAALKDDSFDSESNLNNIRENFTVNIVGEKWLTIIKSVFNGYDMEEDWEIPQRFIFRLRAINAHIRRVLSIVPPIGLVSDTLSRVKSKFGI